MVLLFWSFLPRCYGEFVFLNYTAMLICKFAEELLISIHEFKKLD
jgi:hypothetical protein